MLEPKLKGKSYVIPKQLVWDAWLKVREKCGSAGADGVTIKEFEQGLNDRLFILWNRMSSGSYFPGSVRAVDIPKKKGSRRLGIPNIVDRVAQTAAVMALEPSVEQVFHDDSYGYRPGRSPLEAVAVCRERGFRKDWVLDVDIRKFFDSVPWDLMLKALARHTDQKWVLLYVERWLKAPMLMPDGSLLPREKGTPQGSPISPLIANLFLHYGFDAWMVREFPAVQFERFADDVVIHCASESHARDLREALARRLVEVGLELHTEKTRIVYCKDSNRRGTHEHVSFTFCGYAFRPRKAANKRRGVAFVGAGEKLTLLRRLRIDPPRVVAEASGVLVSLARSCCRDRERERGGRGAVGRVAQGALRSWGLDQGVDAPHGFSAQYDQGRTSF